MNIPLWTIEDFVEATGGKLEGDASLSVNGISIDSRTAKSNDAFFAVKGDQFDGHDFVMNAFQAGASLAVVCKDSRQDMPSDKPLVVVDDVLLALNNLGRASRSRSKAKIIAITGSVGKTSTKDALSAALSESGRTHSSFASYNNHWGVPLTLARMPEDCEYAVFEIGMNAPGEIQFLTELVRPHFAVITGIGTAHLEKFGTVEKIAKAKAEIFDGLVSNGTAVLNSDYCKFDELLKYAAQTDVKNIVRFGEKTEDEIRLVDTVIRDDRTDVIASMWGAEISFTIGAPGQHLVKNALAVLALVKLVGADMSKAIESLCKMKLPKGRGNRLKLYLPEGEALLIDESYNANPTSMEAAIRSLGETSAAGGGKRIAVLGDMLELGKAAPELHAALADKVRKAEIDFVHCVGPQMHELYSKLNGASSSYAESSSKLASRAGDIVDAGDVIMIKGSRGMQMEKLVDALQQTYSEPHATEEA